MFGVFSHSAQEARAFILEQMQPEDSGHDNELATKLLLTKDELRWCDRRLGFEAACLYFPWSHGCAGSTKR
jgi:hypothetical protein